VEFFEYHWSYLMTGNRLADLLPTLRRLLIRHLYRAKTRRHARDLQVHPPAGPGMITLWPYVCST
jgi:hypothetical protein